MRAAADAGIAAAVHAIGDAAVRRALDLMGAAAPGGHPPSHRALPVRPPGRPRPRRRPPGLVVSMQPAHLLTDIPLVERHWGARGRGAYAFEIAAAARHRAGLRERRAGRLASIRAKGSSPRSSGGATPAVPEGLAARGEAGLRGGGARLHGRRGARRRRRRARRQAGSRAATPIWSRGRSIPRPSAAAARPSGRDGRVSPWSAARSSCRGDRPALNSLHASHLHSPHQDRRHPRPRVGQPAQMTALLDAGVDVVRINASHGTPEIRARWIEQLREVLRGPAGGRRRSCSTCRAPGSGSANLAEPIQLAPGRRWSSRPRTRPPRARSPPPTTTSPRDVRVGARILLDDGLLALEVTGIRGERVEAVVHYGGELKSHKGMNLPGSR